MSFAPAGAARHGQGGDVGEREASQPRPPSWVGAVQGVRGDARCATATAMGASSERYRQRARTMIAPAVSGSGSSGLRNIVGW